MSKELTIETIYKYLPQSTKDKIAEAQKSVPTKVIDLAKDLGCKVYASDNNGPRRNITVYATQESLSHPIEVYLNQHQSETHQYSHMALLVAEILIDASNLKKNNLTVVRTECFKFTEDGIQAHGVVKKLAAHILLPKHVLEKEYPDPEVAYSTAESKKIQNKYKLVTSLLIDTLENYKKGTL